MLFTRVSSIGVTICSVYFFRMLVGCKPRNIELKISDQSPVIVSCFSSKTPRDE
jgi:hypothetical protein